MRIIQTAVVKKVLTKSEKQSLAQSFKKKYDQALSELEQLKFLLKRAEHQKKAEKILRIRKEIEAKEEQLQQLRFQEEQLTLLPEGTELKVSEVQYEEDLHVGMEWNEKSREIIVENGVVKEIR
ncbi:YlqD family protein [Aureibacillus halotolerans]|uniref:YlqD protein n=1 Tax=Aureibacillus halotolerans TaxID=1508390 RepID=A0A4R6U7Q9_9BACI|nr:YlqD family protein [Aureibacillus halotolerans]TDQ42401.1 YlqD protein [Aureibacillus halotolerans]